MTATGRGTAAWPGLRPSSPVWPLVLALATVTVSTTGPAATASGPTGPISAAPPQYPRSALPVQALFVVSEAGVSPEDIVTIETLGGALARQQPVIYRVNNDSYDVWLQTMVAAGATADDQYLHDIPGLLTHFAAAISGYVRFDMAGSLDAAVTYCAGTPDRVVVAAASNATIALLERLKVPMEDDLTGVAAFDVYKAMRHNFKHHMVAFQTKGKYEFLIAYAVFTQSPWFEYLGNTGDDFAQMVMGDIEAEGRLGVALGWGPEEQYVHELALHGIYVHASDYDKNLAALSNLQVHTNHGPRGAELPSQPRPLLVAPPPQDSSRAAAAAVHTVAFVMSDGDNLQWLLGPWGIDPKWFGSPDRGKVPMGWTFSPAMLDLAPTVAAGMLRNRTSADEFVVAPSGIGYTYPDTLVGLDAFVNLTEGLMDKMGAGLVNVIGLNRSYAALWPMLRSNQTDAILYYSFCCYYVNGAGFVEFINGKPIVTGRFALWGNGTTGQAVGVQGAIEQLKGQAKDPTTTAGYSLIPVHAWTHSYADILAVAAGLQELGGFEVVTPSELVGRVRGLCPSPGGSYTTSCTQCSVDAQCVLHCASCEAKAGSQPSSCNLRCCNYLANTEGALTCHGTACPLSC